MQVSPEDEEFRRRVREWLAENLTGRFAGLRGAGGPGREHEAYDERVAWNQHLAAAGWTCLGWPAEYGGYDATLARQVIFYEEYARSGAPARVGYLAKVTSEDLLAGLARREAFGRAADPWEVATVILFLASDYASYLTGEVISVSSQHP